MSKQELLECIVPYLPYGLNVLTPEYGIELVVGFCKDELITTEDNVTLDGCKPILRPLSDLTKPCLEGGKVPIEEMKLELSVINGYDGDFNYLGHLDSCHRFSYYNEIPAIMALPYFIVKQLLKWHFDVFGLIEKKYAIDINTLK